MAARHGRLTPIHDPNDPVLRRFRALHSRETRDREGLFLAEGLRFLSEALDQHAGIEGLLVCPAQVTQPIAWKQVARVQAAGVPCFEAPPPLFARVARGQNPQGLVLAVRQRWDPLERIAPAQGLCWCALDTVRAPGNLGTMLRTSEAVGGAGLIFLAPEPDPYDLAVVRASMGAVFRQLFVRTTGAELRAWARRNRCALVGTSPAGETDYRRLRYPRPLVLALGGERQGLPSEVLAACDARVRIPMVGHTDSLNLAVASAVLLYEIFNQWRFLRAEPAGVTLSVAEPSGHERIP